MSNAKIDQNDKSTWLAYNETTGLVENLVVNPITNYLYIYITATDSNTPSAINVAQIDQNAYPTQLAYNETTGLPEAMRCTTNGELLITLV